MHDVVTPEAATGALASVSALAAVGLSWLVAGMSLIGSLRSERATRPASPARWLLDVWHAAGLASLVPVSGMWEHRAPPAIEVARAALAVLLAAAALLLAVWERATQRRYADRPSGAAGRPLFLTYGPYLRVRHPRELAVAALVLATSLALPGWWRPLVACGVFAPSMAARALLGERRARGEWGEAFESYRRAVPLFLPWRAPRRSSAGEARPAARQR